MFENVAGIFWSVGLFVRRHGNLQEWLKSRTPEEIWRDLGEIYFMGKSKPRPKAAAAIYRLLAPAPLGLGIECRDASRMPPLPLTMGARRFLAILGPAREEGFADLEPAEKQKIYARKINVYDTKKIGCVAKVVSGGIGEGVKASYTMKPDDLYVRARIISPERPAASAFQHPKVQVAWTQPYVRA